MTLDKARIDKEWLKARAEDIRKVDYIDPALYRKYNVKRGLRNKDGTGVVAGITTVLSNYGVNIAYLRVFREEKGGLAYTIVESDEAISEAAVEEIKKNTAIEDIMLVKR